MKKNIIRLLICCGLGLSVASCDKFLDREPLGQIGASEYFKTETNANSAVMGMYRTMMISFSFGQSFITVPEFSAVHVEHSAKFQEYELMAIHKLNTVNPWMKNIWQAAYTTINAANNIITEVPNMAEGSISNEKRDQFVGEAKFVRALNFFFLVRAFGNIPVPLTATKEGTAHDLDQSAPADVYKQIVQDLTDASKLLPVNNPNTGDAVRGRASHWAAKALLAKVYLYQGSLTNDYSKAASLADEVIKSGKYSLAADYGSIWTTENSTEAIFELQFDDQATNPLASVANNNASVLFFAKEPFIDGLFEATDKRKAFSYKKEALKTDPTTTRAFMGKFPNFSPASQNFPAIRLAELYLIHAEAKARVDNSVSAASYASLKMVQDRAGVTKPISAYTSLANYITAIQDEKEKELVFEGETWFDQCRTKYALKKHSTLTSENFFLYPIPVDEINQSGKLKQNPGY